MEIKAQTKEDIIGELRRTLLNHIESNERVLAKFNRIMNWLFIIFIALSLTTLTGIAFLIYTVTRPASATGVAMKQVQQLSETVTLQRKLNERDRQDIAKARDQIGPVLRFQDSVNRRKDSIINAQYKKSIK